MPAPQLRRVAPAPVPVPMRVLFMAIAFVMSFVLGASPSPLLAAETKVARNEKKPAVPKTTFVPRRHSKMPGPPLSPQDAIKKMTVPEGFSVELVAAEPDVINPVAMTIDERGRFWITESFEYPSKPVKKVGEGRDRVKVLEDTNGDGKVDKVTVFAEGLNIPSGIAVGHGGVWVANAPDILFYPDADGDAKPDGPPQVIVTGFGRTDTHELPNSLTWGPDGYLYGLNGVFNYCDVTHQGKRHKFTCAMFRIDPRKRTEGKWKGTHDFELFAEGTSNPWGIAFNENGSAFISACVIDHLWHIVETGYYHRQGGPYPPHTWKLGSIVKHKHQMAAYCGITWFDSAAYPEEYRGKLYMGNIHGGCINSDVVTRKGSSYVGKPRPDFMTANDVWFMPVVQKVGPDGCLYVLDWYDRYHCYQDANRDPAGIDRGHGRLYRVRYRNNPHAKPFDMGKWGVWDLVNALDHDNVYFRNTAQRLLQERLLDQRGPDWEDLASTLEHLVLRDRSRRLRLHAMWTLIGGRTFDPRLAFKLSMDRERDPTLIAWCLRAAGDMARRGGTDEKTSAVLRELLDNKWSDEPEVVLQRAIAAPKLAKSDPQRVWKELFAQNFRAGNDQVIPHIVWQNLLPLFDTHAEELIAFLGRAKRGGPVAPGSVGMTPYIVDRVLDIKGLPAASLANVVRFTDARGNAGGLNAALDRVFDAMISGQIKGERSEALKKELAATLVAIRKRGKAGSWQAARLLAMWGDADALKHTRGLITRRDVAAPAKLKALQALIAIDDTEVADVAKTWLEQGVPSAARRQLFAALGRSSNDKVGAMLVAALPKAEADLRPALLDVLSQRKAWQSALLGAIETGGVAKDTVNFNQVRRLQSSSDKAIAQRAIKLWGKVRFDRNPQREKVIASVRKTLMGTQGDPRAGFKVYEKLCAQCHTLHGKGHLVGPDLTTNGRASLEQLLSNVLDPNLVIGDGYQARIVETEDGRTLTGFIQEQTDQRIVLLMPGGIKQTIARDEVTGIRVSPLSLMPEGMEQGLKQQEIADLFALLSLDKHPDDPNARLIPGASSFPLAKLNVPASVSNHLLKASFTSNTNKFGRGKRGRPADVVYDPKGKKFLKPSQWHEDGVPMQKDLGVLPEGKAVWWQAAWEKPVAVNLITLSGCYPNQPQPGTAWKIELRVMQGEKPTWVVLDKGVGGWVDNGRYLWGGAGAPSKAITGFRVSLFSRDGKTRVKSPHFRGEPGVSWVVGLAPSDASLMRE